MKTSDKSQNRTNYKILASRTNPDPSNERSEIPFGQVLQPFLTALNRGKEPPQERSGVPRGTADFQKFHVVFKNKEF